MYKRIEKRIVELTELLRYPPHLDTFEENITYRENLEHMLNVNKYLLKSSKDKRNNVLSLIERLG